MELLNHIFAKFLSVRFRKAAALMVLLLAATVLIGWQFNIEFLKRPISKTVAMNPLTALCFLLSSVALFFNSKNKTTTVLAFTVIALCVIKLISALIGSAVSVDGILFHDKLNKDLVNGMSNRMAANTTIGFLLVGSVFLKRTRKEIKTGSAELLTLIILAQGCLSIIGYIFKVPEFYGILSMFPMAIHTAIGFVILAVGMLSLKPLGPFASTLVNQHSGGFLARYLIPLTVLAPVSLGILKLYGQRHNLYSDEFGLMLVVSSVIVLATLIIWRIASIINQKDAEQARVELELAELNSHLEEIVVKRTTEAIRSRNEALKVSRQLVESKNRFRALVEHGGDAVVVLSAAGKPMFVSHSTHKMLGYTKDQLLNMRLADIIHPEDWQHVRSTMIRAFRNPNEPIPCPITRVKHKDGTWHYIESTTTNLLANSTIKGLVNNFRDVTDRVEVEKRLEASEIQFRKTLDTMLEGMQIIDYNWRYQYVNDAAVKHGSKTREQLLGRTMMEVYPGIEHSNLFYVLKQCMANRQMQQFENEFTYPNGTTAWFKLSIQPVPEGVFILSIDITDRKLAQQELLRTNESLEQVVAERTAELAASNKELEAFSYSVSHDLRAPLRAINGFAKMLHQTHSKQLDEDGNRLLSVISTNATTMGQLIDDLLNFSRIGRKKVDKHTVNMHALVSEAIESELQLMEDKTYSIEVDTLPTVLADAQLIKQVWANLVSNALKYSATTKHPKIQVSAEVKDSETIFSIKDNGVGFDMQYADKLFGVFQRLHSKREFEGTGVGLALAYRIVRKHGGNMWANAQPNKGATFYFTLPNHPVQNKNHDNGT